jgi:hypothetical protein
MNAIGRIRIALCCVLTFSFPIGLFAQNFYIPFNRSLALPTEGGLNSLEDKTHTGVKPFLVKSFYNDSMPQPEFNKEASWIYRKLFYENVIQIDSSDFSLSLSPILNLELSKDFKASSNGTGEKNLYSNTRGYRAVGTIGAKFYFESSFFENQSVFPQYLEDFVNKYQVVPGQGRVKPFKETGFDYAMASGLASYSPIKALNITFGHGKNFIGEGYRSLLLSDNAFNYPYIKTNAVLFKHALQYTSIIASLQSLNRSLNAHTPEALFVRKAASFHYLSINLGRFLQVGLFESIVWKASEENYAKRPHPFIYNPLLFANSIIFNKDTLNNVVYGVNIKMKPLNRVVLYGQLAIDDISKGRTAYQIGIKTFDFTKIANLSLQAEFNNVKAYTYSFNDPIQSFSHYNQALAHPFGNGFKEVLGIVNYSYKRILFQYKGNYINGYSTGSFKSAAYDIFESDQTNALTNAMIAAQKEKVFYTDIQLGYLINPAYNLQLIGGFVFRDALSVTQNHYQIVYLSLRTALSNLYYDF